MPSAITNIQYFNEKFPVPLSSKGMSYQFLRLENGLMVLIISDPTEQISAASLSVATGHHADPDGMSGLAHLCEHMICVSSKEHPEIDKYKKKVYEAGGTCNAVTVSERTSFFFSLPTNKSDKFAEILEIYASYFRNPLFNSDYANREIIAIDNEHEKNVTRPSRKCFQGLRLLSNKNCEFHRFSTGNYDTLNHLVSGNDVTDALREFFNTEYLPNRMALTIRSPLSLNQIKKLVISNFSELSHVPSKGMLHIFKKPSKKPISSSISVHSIYQLHIAENVWLPRYRELPFRPKDLARSILINSPETDPLIRVDFIVKKNTPNLTTKELAVFKSFWCNILGSESEKSLYNALISKQYITELITGGNFISSTTTCLEIQLKLTTLGINNTIEVLQYLLSCISSICDDNNQQQVLQIAKMLSQHNGIELYNFYHSELNINTAGSIRSLSERLLLSFAGCSQWFFSGSPNFDFEDKGFHGAFEEGDHCKQFWIYEAKRFMRFVRQNCVPENMALCIACNKRLWNNLDWSLEEESGVDMHYRFDYSIRNITLSKLIMKNHTNKEYHFALPGTNKFAPSIVYCQKKQLELMDRTTKGAGQASLGFAVGNSSNSFVPTLAGSSPGYQIWIKMETDPIYADKILISAEIVFVSCPSTIDQVIALELLCIIVKTKLKKEIYSALTVGYNYDIIPSFKGDAGLIVHVGGPKQYIFELLECIIMKLKDIVPHFRLAVRNSEFRKARSSLLKKYAVGESMPSHVLASLGLMAIMEENTWLLKERVSALEDIDLETTDKIFQKLFQKAYVSLFLQGDLDKNNSTQIRNVLSCLHSVIKTFCGEQVSSPSTICLKPGSNFTCKAICRDPSNALAYFVQCSMRDKQHSKALTRFTAFILSNPLARKLRFEYQIGYIVLVGLRVFRKVEGIHVTVMSGQLSPESIELKVEECITEWFNETLENLDERKFTSKYKSLFLENLKGGGSLATNGGPSSITQNFLISDPINSTLGRKHQGFWDQIVNRSYLFSHNTAGEDDIDIRYIQNLTLVEFKRFVRESVLPDSKTRVKVSAMVSSSASEEEIEEQLRPVRIYCFLSSLGLPIKKYRLEKILEESGSSKLALSKNLLKYYRKQGKSIRLILAGMAKITADASTSWKTKGKDKEDSHFSNASEIDINRLQEWQKAIGFIKSGDLHLTLTQFQN